MRKYASLLDGSGDTAIHFDDLNGKSFRVPSKKGKEHIIKTLSCHKTNTSNIRITTIHNAKGQTFDAVLLVSARDKQGTPDGYWTQWVDNTSSEAARLAYVASSRPRHLLVWAIPDPTEHDKDKMRRLGFHVME